MLNGTVEKENEGEENSLKMVKLRFSLRILEIPGLQEILKDQEDRNQGAQKIRQEQNPKIVKKGQNRQKIELPGKQNLVKYHAKNLEKSPMIKHVKFPNRSHVRGRIITKIKKIKV